MSDAQRTPALALYRRALSEARPHWRGLALVLVLGLLSTPLALLGPIPMTLVLDNVLGQAPPRWPFGLLLGSDREALFHVAVAIGVLSAVLGLGHRLVEWLVREWIAERMVLEYRAKMLAHGLSLSALDQAGVGAQDLYARVSQDAPSLQWTALYGWMPVVWSFTAIGGFFYATAVVNTTLAVVALSTSVPLVLLLHWTQARLRGAWHGVREAEAEAEGVLNETIRAQSTVAVFGREADAVLRFRDRARVVFRSRLRTMATEGGLSGLFGLATALGGTVVLFLGVRDVQGGLMTPGELVLVLTYVGQLFTPLQAIGTHITGQQRALACAERTFALLDRAPAVVDPPNPRRLGRAEGRLGLCGVTFAYPNGGRTVLQDVDLDIRAGTRVGIVGPSGAGKSTLVKLLMRQFDPQAGAVTLDGADLRTLALADLRRQFSVVAQEPVLLSMSVADNIAYGRPNADRAAIVDAARRAGAHDFIQHLPQGYDTRIGEKGPQLSGGERQRIALARAFLRDAPILVLDEPTSALDTATEADVLDALDRLAEGRTVFMITHRRDALRDCDLVLTVDDGHVKVEPGPRASYPRLVNAAAE